MKNLKLLLMLVLPIAACASPTEPTVLATPQYETVTPECYLVNGMWHCPKPPPPVNCPGGCGDSGGGGGGGW